MGGLYLNKVVAFATESKYLRGLSTPAFRPSCKTEAPTLMAGNLLPSGAGMHRAPVFDEETA